MGPGRKKGSINLLHAAGRRRVGWLVSVLALLFLSGPLGLFLLVGHGEIQTATPPRAAGAPRPPAGEGPTVDEDMTRERAGEKARAALVSARVPTCDDERVLVDRTHELPPGYVPKDLVSLPDNGVPTLGGREMLLRREAAEHLRELVYAAAADGEELVVASAFRSYEAQRVAYGRLRSIYGAAADAMSATPGHSQHQLGTAVDFTNAAAAYQVKRRFGYTSAAGWLHEHAADYGFVLAYPPGDESGYAWEPWHYRYLGEKHAERLEQSGMNLQGFLVREGVMPDC